MPLRARLNGMDILSFEMTPSDWNGLRDVYRTQDLLMPCCGHKGIPKVSKLGTHFFAHSRGGQCASAPETKEHLQIKSILAIAAKKAGWNVTTEWRGETPSGEKWTADVFCTKASASVALEVQWSPQSDDETRRRQDKYTESGVRCAWFIKPARNKMPVRYKNLITEEETPAFHIQQCKTESHYNVPEFNSSLDLFAENLMRGHIHWYPKKDSVFKAGIVRGCDTCWRCKKKTYLVLGVILYGPHGIPFQMLEFDRDGVPELLLKNGFANMRAHGIGTIKQRYSKTEKQSYLSNGCVHCDALQGRFFLQDLISNYYHYGDGEVIEQLQVKNGEGIPMLKGMWREIKKDEPDN